MEDQIVVSIAVITYNHGQYIREALDSILEQEVDFQYEIVVGDDSSSDETCSILKNYERKYPGIFKLILREKNVGPTKNLYDVFRSCSGKYIAQLEGDDFWNDRRKLQKQVNFLEKNDKYIGVTHSCNILCEDALIKDFYEKFYHCQDGYIFQFNDFYKKRFAGHTCTLVYRNIYSNGKFNYNILHQADKFIGDQTINLLLVMQGEIYCMDSKMSTYRLIIKEGAGNFVSQFYKINVLKERWNYLLKLNDYCLHSIGKSFIHSETRTEFWSNSLRELKGNPNRKNFRIFAYFTKIIIKYPLTIICIIKLFIKKKVLPIVMKNKTNMYNT